MNVARAVMIGAAAVLSLSPLAAASSASAQPDKREDLRVRRTDYFFLLARAWNDWVQQIPTSRVQLPKGGLTSSDQIPWLKVAEAREPAPVSEDNPAALGRSLSARERDRRKAS